MMSMERTSMTMSKASKRQLDGDVLHEIFLRLPIKSLARFRLISKQFQSIISNPKFLRSHLQFWKPKPLTMLIHPNNEVTYFNFDVSLNPRYIYLDVGHQFSPAKPTCFIPLGSCDGLVCLYNLFKKIIVLWNPTTRKLAQIPSPQLSLGFHHSLKASGFAFVPSINDYRIVMLTQCSKTESFESRRSCIKINIYSMRDGRWREELDATADLSATTLNFSDPLFNNRHSISIGISLNNALHWAIGQSSTIIKFDLVNHVFEKIPLPSGSCSTIGIIRPNNLAACCLSSDFTNRWVELWKLKEYGEWDSWEQVYEFELDDFGLYGVHVKGIEYEGKLLINTDKGLALVDPSGFEIICVLKLDHDYSTYVVPFVTSLVSPHNLI